ncbi:NAD(+) diphosphatase [Microbulbifer sp. OS29]|uniref:NAD(+) diphosphatase n=1 Tax=Microbulbifer okhotskensis TaxID=2926617 RepID=A0A9X2EJC1_9GAMM|nr:NAD(+) diphosphatase [Microbulbifer okhotskensis]MCO1333302.1 NAD(+) diphosphatase [Microbulbifer okhotskensis]
MADRFVPAGNVWAVPEFAQHIIIAEGLILCRDDLFLHNTEVLASEAVRSSHYLGELSGQACGVHVVSRQIEIVGYEWRNLRSLLTRVEESLFALAGRALQISHWDGQHQFCGRCGTPTIYHPSDRARTCSACDLTVYPRISPCVIMLVTRGQECLLARHASHRNAMYTALAGFIEPGESAEQALAREVQEEVGLSVGELKYVGSQSWPFPGQLMIGYLAEWQGGDLCLDPNEIEEAEWFHYLSLPAIPPVQTLSGRLIHTFAEMVAAKRR